MSDKNLFLGDSTYPHTPEPTLPMRLRSNDDNGLTLETDLLMSEAADRIEQLERELEGYKDTHLAFMQLGMKHERLLLNHENLCAELAEAKKGHARYEFVRKLNVYQFKKIFTMNLTSAVRFDDLVDAAMGSGQHEQRTNKR